MRLILYILFVFPILGYSQETWTLKQCIDHAYSNNISIKQAELSASINEQQSIAAKGQLLPSLNGFAAHTYNFGQRIDPFTNQFANSRVQSNNFYLNSQVTLFNGMQNRNSIAQALVNHSIQQQNLEKTKNDIALVIASNYLQILFCEELNKINEQQLAMTNHQMKRLEKLIRAGSSPEGDLIAMEAQQANDELNLINSENQYFMAVVSLKQLLQLDTINDFRVAIPDMEMSQKLMINSTPGQVYDVALNTMPEVKAGDLQVESAMQGISIAKGRNFPTLTLSGSVGTGYSGASKKIVSTTPFLYESGYTASGEPVYSQDFIFETTTKAFTDQVKDNLNESIGLNLSVPIFNGFSTRTSIEIAKINKEIAILQQEQIGNQLRNDIEQAYVDAVAALKKYNATLKTVDAQKQALDFAQKRFEVGLVNSLVYNDAKTTLANNESQLIQAKYDYLFKIKILEFYQGKSLAF